MSENATGIQPSSPSFLRTIMIISTFGGLLFGYDTGVINGALPYMSAPDQLNLTPLTEGLVVSSLLLGAALGSIVGGVLSDKHGRRKNIIHLALLFFLAAVGCSLAPNVEIMVICRFLLGLAVGGASVTVPTYLAEMSLMENRGRMVTQNELMIVTGQFLAFIVNAIFGVMLGNAGYVWRYMLIVAALPAVVLYFGMLRMPESPRWLISQGKIAEALQVLKRARQTEEKAIAEFNEIQDTVEAEAQMGKATWKDLNLPWVRRLLIVGIGVAVASQCTGINTIMYYGTEILKDAGFSTTAALIGNTVNGLASVVATSIGIWLVEKVRRRQMLLTGLTGTTLALFLIAMSSMLMQGSPVLPYIVVGLTVMFLAFMQGAIGPILWLLLAEIFPLRLRGLGMGVCVLFVWITNFIIGFFFPALLSSFGLYITFFIFVGIGICSLIFVKLYVPETKGRTLEELENQFRNYYKKGVVENTGLGK
ncbi:Major myo-inositol transporter IolT [Propionispora sp. 2/2-37]|uniref:sugar porter family MFS transporter n=1 Tax=Propionispora sp. 2/2-37 TaxID=1677858 RepID=UPI0006BB7217|nr:sugar porter family MFS transporter [Propionispora sp. 2/2-37]CUH95263.1 Major myo-inositol transporter IolT [Propionispora sp. 2/2-37]